MTVHLVKLCVGVDTVQDLHDWQRERFAAMARAGQRPEHCHKTLQGPRRRDDLLDGGSLYWVIKGVILARQRILELRDARRQDGRACCGIVLNPEIVTTRSQPRRAFQGWRYLDAADAPPDARTYQDADTDLPPGLGEALRELRLID